MSRKLICQAAMLFLYNAKSTLLLNQPLPEKVHPFEKSYEKIDQ